MLDRPTRSDALRQLSERVFDVLIVGGGITGAGIARDSAMRGLSTALIEKSDFASGTSSRSSRLVHGGVRYLEHGHFHLVYEASAERRVLLDIAPHLVQPLAFSWPVYSGHRIPLWKLRAGLTLYDVLSLFRNVRSHRRRSAKALLEEEPTLEERDLCGGVRYYDAAADDSRLTLANVIDATVFGAVATNYVAFAGCTKSRDGIKTVQVKDTLTGERFEVRSRLLINATGPWSDEVEKLSGASTRTGVRGSKGVHVTVDRNRIGNRGAIVMLHPRDGRVMFALPAGRHTLIGTTDTFEIVSPDDARASISDVEYLLEAANAYFPDAGLRNTDVVAAWAGIRPLVATSRPTGAASREHDISSSDGSIRVTGGKLTTYRAISAQVVDAAGRMLNRRLGSARTAHRALPAVDKQFACTIGDLLIRRTKVAFETTDNGRSAARSTAKQLALSLGWDALRLEREIARYDTEVSRVFGINPW